jgi:hypothetical protein
MPWVVAAKRETQVREYVEKMAARLTLSSIAGGGTATSTRQTSFDFRLPEVKNGAANGIRTRDPKNHNLVL